jgi:putative N-acetylmannosamine-6-phosphate epimerase
MMQEKDLSLEEVRDNARNKLKGICGVYRNCDGAETRICQGHNYGSPIGMGGIGSGISFTNNSRALSNIRLNTRLIDEDFIPDVKFNFLGKILDMPVMGASVSGVNSFGGEEIITEKDFCRFVVSGCKDAGTLGWRGDSFNYSLEHPYGIEAIAEAGGHGVQIVKPRDQSVIIEFFKLAEKARCTAVGVDLDGCGSYAMNKHNQQVFRKTRDELKELVDSTSMPVIFKGIMTVKDALISIETGAKVIVVSNHGGRVLDNTPGVAEVLPEIAKAVGKSAMVIADGGIRNGYDVLKMLALGADAVLIGRDIVRAAVGGGTYGVSLQMKTVKDDLSKAMKITGCRSLDDITRDIIY